MKKRFYLSHFVLCVFLICFGAVVGGTLIYILFNQVTAFSFIAFAFYIPTFAVGCVLPIYAGIAYLLEIMKGKDDKMYPESSDLTDDLLNQLQEEHDATSKTDKTH